jgi:CYTH domain-containing protein
MVEIERKFLVTALDFIQQATAKLSIAQGYLNSHPARTVRIRTQGECGYITIKGKGNESGTTRMEWETEITLSEAKALLAICEEGGIHKTRYRVPAGIHTYEVDVFEGENKGLVVAEIELTNEQESFSKPHWLGQEVTGDQKYYNAALSKVPYLTWPKEQRE